MAIIGVDGIRALNEGTVTLWTKEELGKKKFGKHAKEIVEEASSQNYIREPYTIDGLAKRVPLSKKTITNSLEAMVYRNDQVFTKFKAPDVAEYVSNYDTHVGKSWLHEALDDLTIAIDQLGESGMAKKLFRVNYSKLPWNYVLLMRVNDEPVYSDMLKRFSREF